MVKDMHPNHRPERPCLEHLWDIYLSPHSHNNFGMPLDMTETFVTNPHIFSVR